MKSKILIGIFAMLALTCSAFSQFQQTTSRSLFSDVKAYREGDAIMILITEDVSANNSADGSESRSTALGGSLGINSTATASGNISSGNEFTGKGSTSRKESIRSKLSARIVEVDDNGNLSIEGKRTTKINGETQTIVIKGYVRPVDVLPTNSVYSYSILDLTLTIEGDGTVSKTQEPGLITKFLRFLF